MMNQGRHFQMIGNVGTGGQLNIDTTYTKIFVGGLAWETKRDTMRHYFEQFGEIHEAVVIADKITGRSKGYGFVTFKDPDAAMRACQNPSPVIDGRRANCNLASLGAHRTRPPPPQQGIGRFRPASALVGPSSYHGSSSTFFHQPTGQYTFPLSAYGYNGYSQDTMYPMNYYSMYGGQHYSAYYTTGTTGTPGVYPNFYPFYAQGVQAHSYGVQYPPVLQYPYLSHRYASPAVPSLPPSTALPNTTSDTTMVASRMPNAAGVTVMAAVVGTSAAASQATGVVSEQSSSN